MDSSLSECDWSRLVKDIHHQQVVPIVGPGLESITHPDSQNDASLSEWLSPLLAEKLDQPIAPGKTFEKVVSDYLRESQDRTELYHSIREVFREHSSLRPSKVLGELASIRDFHLFVSSCFDPMLAKAIADVRKQVDVREYFPGHNTGIPQHSESTLLYHIFGNTKNPCYEFAVCEEDYIEFIFALHVLSIRTEAGAASEELHNLFVRLKNSQMLFLGAPHKDWVVRFLLRAAKQGRVSKIRRTNDLMTEHPQRLTEEMVIYFDNELGSTRIIQEDPAVFISKLADHWKQEFGRAHVDWNTIHKKLDPDPVKNTIFISYAREDTDAVMNFVNGLENLGIPYWLDTERLRAGRDYERDLESAVKESSFFISIISEHTESFPARYFHREREWAKERQPPGYVFYIPVVIDNVKRPPKLEPDFGSKMEVKRLEGGNFTPEFSEDIATLWREYSSPAGRPQR